MEWPGFGQKMSANKPRELVLLSSIRMEGSEILNKCVLTSKLYEMQNIIC